jgi:carbamoyltransferase
MREGQMKILGISLGHDSSLALINDGKIIQIFEAERYFRQKRYKLHCFESVKKKIPSGYQIVDIEDLEIVIKYIMPQWGSSYDCVAIQNQGRIRESNNLLKILTRLGVKYKSYINVDHHLSHAALAYFTSPFNRTMILSYDGMGNDGQTIIFKASKNKLTYFINSSLKMGSCYNNLGYILGIKPEVCGTTSGKTMGLTAYGKFVKDWEGKIKKHILNYTKLPPKKIKGLNSYGKAHTVNTLYINTIGPLKSFAIKDKLYKDILKYLGLIKRNDEIKINDLKSSISQDLAKTFQVVWTNIVLDLLIKSKEKLDQTTLCVVGGCALNGITNYIIETEMNYDKIHYVPNPSDCGLAAGCALYAYWLKSGKVFKGYDRFFSPYIGMPLFDAENELQIARNYSHITVESDLLLAILANLIKENKIIGVINGLSEIGPRALGNRSILCNPLNKNMREILNKKVKNREWYRPFAPIVPLDDLNKYFTSYLEIPYMSVICYTKSKYRDVLPSITHVDGSARVQTVTINQHGFMYKLLKEYKKLTGVPILLNTSFNPGGEPILNYLSVGLEMLNSTELDFVVYGNKIYWSSRRGVDYKEYLSKIIDSIKKI